ncbi:SWIM zinc finger family protein [Streptosporangium canum]|uniref:SWIM zinc finger family protein n=1 Tax=Streptosporangium canum TaxID=324952 RepID=UPI00367FCC28
MDCSCPDWGFPCKHLSAVLYVLAEAFDDDPFLVLAWRGMAKDVLLGALRETGGSGGEEPVRPGLFDVTDAPFAERLADFYAPGASPARLRDRTALPVTPPDLLLRTVATLLLGGSPSGPVHPGFHAPAHDPVPGDAGSALPAVGNGRSPGNPPFGRVGCTGCVV